jgi:hypothetical protein
LNDEPRQVLRRLISEGRVDPVDDPALAVALLSDLTGRHKLEIKLIKAAAEEGVPADLRDGGGLSSVRVNQLARRLEQNHGTAPDNARWAVESWAFALGLDVPRARKPKAKAPGVPEPQQTDEWAHVPRQVPVAELLQGPPPFEVAANWQRVVQRAAALSPAAGTWLQGSTATANNGVVTVRLKSLKRYEQAAANQRVLEQAIAELAGTAPKLAFDEEHRQKLRKREDDTGEIAVAIAGGFATVTAIIGTIIAYVISSHTVLQDYSHFPATTHHPGFLTNILFAALGALAGAVVGGIAGWIVAVGFIAARR